MAYIQIEVFCQLNKLHAHYMKNPPSTLIFFWQNPPQARTGEKKLPANKLILCPMVDNTCQISITKGGELKENRVKLGSLSLHDGSHIDIGLIPSKTELSKNDKTGFSEAENPGTRAAYWYAMQSSEEECNLEFMDVQVNMSKDCYHGRSPVLVIPCLTNKLDIAPFCKLTVPQLQGDEAKSKRRRL